jgi:uncharacterized membrane protein YidH (DUF202 family)
MTRKFAIVAAMLAAFAFTVQSADAHGRHHHHHVGKRLTAVAITVGAASTATYFAINNWHTSGWNNSSGLTRLGAWGITTVGCAAVSPIVATVVLKRQLSYREAHILVGSCVIPIIGGWLVNEAYNAHILWAPDEQVEKKRHHHHHHHHKM